MPNRIILVPLESLVERYSESWYRNFPLALQQYGVEHLVIDGEPLSDHVSVGCFLDANSTCNFKFTQLQKIAQMFHNKEIRNGDTFFFYDIEFWGLESVRVMAQLNKIDVKICGFLHAASYTKEDALAVAAPYQKYTEIGWLTVCDKVFVGSHYHKEAVYERRILPLVSDDIERFNLESKIKVTGNPLFQSDYGVIEGIPKKKQLVLPNRFDWEKRPNISLDFARVLKNHFPDLEIVVTTSRPKFKSNKEWLVDYARCLEADRVITIKEGLTKAQYHSILQESKLMMSNSPEENFGYTIVESLVYGTYPLLPNICSHSELVNNDERFLYNDEDEIVEKVDALLNLNEDVSHYAERYYDSHLRILDSMLEID